jgi:hypothetical protein
MPEVETVENDSMDSKDDTLDYEQDPKDPGSRVNRTEMSNVINCSHPDPE